MGGVGGGQDPGAGGATLEGPPVVDVGGGVETDPGVAMGVVVPVEEPLAEAAGVLQAAELAGEVRAVLEGLELGFGVGVVVALTG